MSSEQPQKFPRSPEGTPCWIEIPSRDLQKMKVGNVIAFDSIDRI
jgi:hypothetical protein